MEDRALLARMEASLLAFIALLGSASPRARVLELGGVLAAIVPAAPDRSVVNSVVYERTDQLADALGRLAEAYEEAGVRAWTVWVPEHDREAAVLLERAGHHLDAAPAAMGLELDAFEAPAFDDVEIEPTRDIAEVARINDEAYGFPGDFSRALAGFPGGLAHLYLALVDGAPAASTMAYDHDGDCGIYLVATLDAARGRGLASALLARALVDGRTRGCATTTLQATAMGTPVYVRLGYREVGRIQMWERRRPTA